jgi:hypothetical protein
MDDVHAARFPLELLGDLARAVGRAVVDHENVEPGIEREQGVDQRWQVLPLIEGGDDHEGCHGDGSRRGLAHGFAHIVCYSPAPRSCGATLLLLIA